ncbi:HTH domain-containing protein [Lysinibacillus louembei]|uniref:HTH domain-containing protein n=1 Tax=Lysinibacillus louembei TaxID=1470088 RepID=A0ABZ0RXR1_9BACI|nr:HTH domain-containing protein [Lysinibacillus louembei]WPK13018.1 HTH domain-containing protein [Lysinibacillus louembei]
MDIKDILSINTNFNKTYKQELQDLTDKFNLTFEQLPNLLTILPKELDDLLNQNVKLTANQERILKYKLTMLNHGFSLDLTAKERVQLIIDSLVKQFGLSIENISRITNIEEEEILSFQKNTPISREVEMNVIVNIMMLNSVLIQN